MSSDDNTNLTANELEFIANMTNMFRTTLSQRLSGQTSSRDIDKECGYPEDVNMLLAQDYRLMYDKFGIAERVVNLFPDEMWGINPEIYDDATEGVTTPFEERFTSICRSLAGESWLIDDKYNPFWEHLWRLDRLAGIGRFGVMLLGLAVEGDLSIPLPGFEDDNDKNKFGYTFNAEAELKKQDKGDRKLTDLLYMRVFDESLVQVSVYETRRNNRRYGLPVYYNITLNDPFISHTGIGSDSGHEVRVHWSRVIHFCDNKMTSEVYGVPRQRSVWPHLLDLRKTYGGSAEMYWQGAFPGLSFETHPQLGTAVKIDAKAMQEQVQSYFNGLQRYFALTGTSAKTLSPQIVDPTSQLEKQLEAICIKLGCPIRIFKGSERGELASSQDKDSWDERMLSRWNIIAVPNIVRPTIDRLIQVGVLPIPSEGYFVHRPDNKKPNKTEQAQIATSRMQAISTYVSSGADVILPPMTFLTSELGYTQEEAKKIIEEAAELNIEVAEETQEYNDTQKEEMAAQGFGAQGGPNFLQGNPPQPGQQPIPSGQEQPQEPKPGGPPKGKIPPQLQGKQFQANTGAGPTTFPFPRTENQSELVVNKIVKTGENEWSVLSQEGKNLGRFNSLKKAKNRLRQVEYFKHVNNELGGSDECGSWELVTNEDQEKAKNEGRKLNKPFRTPGGPKKFGVYVKNDKGNVVLVRFGDPNMKIKRDDPDRRASFRARHQCDSNPGPKWKARYWACRTWTKTPVSQVVNFDPNQPRAKDGKWTSDDSNSSTEPQISLEQADSSWEDYGFASLVKSISKGAPLTGTDLAGNPITPEYLREAQQAERILQEQAENNTITPKEKFKGVYRAQFEDSSVNIRDKYKRGSVVEFDSLTAVSLEEGFAQKYLDPQYAGFQDENEWSAGFSGDGSDVPAMVLFNIQSKDNKIPGYNLQHTDLPEAIIPKGSRYKVARVEEYESNKYRITLYNNGKTPHNFGSTVNFDPNQPRDEDGRWTSGGSSSIQLPDYTIKQITQGDRINFLDKSQRHSILKSMGVDRDAVEELDQLFDYHRHGGSSQEYADAKIAEELHRDTPLGNAIRAQIQLEEHLYSELERTRNDWADYHETQSKNEMRRAWENKYPPMNDDAYESWKEQWDSTEKYKIDEMRRPDKFYRKGGATKDVLSTSTNSEGAQSHSVTGAYQPHFKPDNEWSSGELHSMGYRILGGYAFGSMGYSGESEVTWIKYDQPTTNQSRCWEGYEPVPGKEPYSEDSCRRIGSDKKKKKKKKKKKQTNNAFCPTGPGGGIDNSCPPKKVTSYADAEAVGAQKMYEAQALAKEFTNLMHGEILFGLVEQDKSKFDKLKSHINSMSEEDKTYFKKFLKTAMEDSAAFTKDEMSLVMKSLDTPPTEQKTITSSLDEAASNFVEKLKLGSVGELSMNDIDELNAISQHITDLPSKDQQYVLKKIDNIIAEDLTDPKHPEQYQLFMDEKASLLEGAILKQKFETGGGLSPDEEEKLFSLYPGLGTIEATPTDLPSETINPHVGKQFPASLDNLEHVKNMGGSTGATLVRDPVTGNLFVKKTGNNPDHIRNEYRVEQIYKAAGVPVLTSQLYENGGAPVKLSVYQPELVSLGSLGKKEFDVAVAKIQEDFALDATLANWDVVGQNLDNVMVDPVTGVVYRIDVGGSMSFRAQGGLKLSQWNEANNELTSMKESPKNPTAKKIFGPMTDQQMIASITKLENKAQDIQHSMKMTGVSESDQTKFAARLVNAVSHKESIDAAASVQISKPTGSISTPTMDATTLKSVVASKKMGSDFAEKVAFLNPNGIEGNTVFVPMVGGPSGSWKIGNKEAIDHMKSVLPEGTKLQGVMINKVKEGGFKISTKTEETAYKEARKSFGQISLNPYLPGSSKVIPVIGGQITKNAQFDLKELGLPHESPLQNSTTLLQSYKSMEPSEYKAVKDFTGWASGDIRKAFWNPDKASSEDKKTAKEMVKGLKKIPVYNGVVYRGCKSSPNMDKEIEKIKKAGIGAVWSDTAPHSMSRSQKVAAGFSGGRNLFVIKTKTGRSVEGLSSYAGEKEVVGMPGTRYRIVGIHEDAKIDIKFATYKSFSTVVELEEM